MTEIQNIERKCYKNVNLSDEKSQANAQKAQRSKFR